MAAIVSAPDPAAAHPLSERGGGEFLAAQVPDPVQHLLLPVGEVFLEPGLKEILHGRRAAAAR